MPRDEATLLDIANAARLVQAFVRDMTKKIFRYPILPWSLMAGMRDQLIYGYDAVELDEVWNTATRDGLEVLIKIEPLLPQQPDSSP